MNLENEKIIEKFLFGEMAEEERSDFEEKFILDENLFEEVKAVEDELIEKYIRGWLPAAEQTKFEKNFLTTKKRQERVEFSRQLFEKLEDQREEPVVAPATQTTANEESIWDKFAGFFSTPKFAFASAFALLLVVFGSWFLYQNFNNKTEFVKNENTDISKTPEAVISPTPEVSPTASPVNTPENQNNPTDLDKNDNSGNTGANNRSQKIPAKTPPTKPKKTPEPVKTPPLPRAAPNPVLTILAGTVRSGGKNNVLNLPKTAQVATLRLKLESVDYKTYQAQLTDADGNIIFQRGNLKARKSSVNFFIPTKNLKRGDYIIKLYGKNEAGENESVADFQFRVNR